MAQVAIGISADEKELVRALARSERRIAKLEDKLRSTGRTAQRAGAKGDKLYGKSALRNIKAMATGLGVGGIAGAVAVINRKYETWLQNTREIAAETRKAASEFVAFAALQEGGTKKARVLRTVKLAASFGITDRAAAFNAVQALQSALGGDFEKGLKAARVVFAATQTGVPLESALEAELQGGAQGQAPGQTLRNLFVAGQASARDPATLAKAAPGLLQFSDKVFAAAVAAVIAAAKPNQAEVFTRQAGRALSKVSSDAFQETFKKLGVENATRKEKLLALRAAGITTPEQLGQAGLTEIRQSTAVALLLQNIDELLRIEGEVRTKATPGLFARKRRGIEKELPGARTGREIEVLRTQTKDLQAFGPRATESANAERLALIRGVALRRLGKEEGALGLDFIDEEGRVSPFAFFRAKLEAFPGGGAGNIDAEVEKVTRELENLDPRFARVVEFEQRSKRLSRLQSSLGATTRDRLNPFNVFDARGAGELSISLREQADRAREGIRAGQDISEILRAGEQLVLAAQELRAAVRERRGGPTLGKPDDEFVGPPAPFPSE